MYRERERELTLYYYYAHIHLFIEHLLCAGIVIGAREYSSESIKVLNGVPMLTELLENEHTFSTFAMLPSPLDSQFHHEEGCQDSNPQGGGTKEPAVTICCCRKVGKGILKLE